MVELKPYLTWVFVKSRGQLRLLSSPSQKTPSSAGPLISVDMSSCFSQRMLLSYFLQIVEIRVIHCLHVLMSTRTPPFQSDVKQTNSADLSPT